MRRSGIRAGLVLGALLALAPARPARVAAQEVIPGVDGKMVTADVAPDQWVMDAVRRAEGLGLLARPLPFRAAISLDVAGEVLEEARNTARGRGAGLEALTEGWLERLYREYGGVAAGGVPAELRLLGLHASVAGAAGDGLAAPGFGEVGAVRTGAVPLEDEAWVGVAGEATAAVGTRVGLLVEPAVRTEGVHLQRVDVAAGIGNWKVSVGRQPLGLSRGVATGLVLRGAVPMDRIELRTERPGRLGGMLGFLGPAGAEVFIGRIWDEDRHYREPYIWGGTLSIQPFRRFGVAVHRAAMFGGRGYDAPLTVKTIVDMLIGRVSNLGFENQVVSVEGRYRLPTEGWLPLTAYLEWGAEDAAGGWWDVPGRVFGLETPAIPGLEAVSLGAAYTSIAEQCCFNSPWYRHGAFPGSWAAEDRPLGHPLGGQGSEWLLYGGYDRPERGYQLTGQLFRRDREGQNLYVPGREESHGLEVEGRWTEPHGVELEAGVRVESGSGWTEQRLGIGANLYF